MLVGSVVRHDISYHRFLALVFVGELGASTQRALADHLGVTEPSVSRMTAVLAAAGLLHVEPDPAGGNRRRLSLTDKGTRLVAAVRGDFEDRDHRDADLGVGHRVQLRYHGGPRRPR